MDRAFDLGVPPQVFIFLNHLDGHRHFEALQSVIVYVFRLMPGDRDPMALSFFDDVQYLFEHRTVLDGASLLLLGLCHFSHSRVSPVIGILSDV